MLDFEYSDYDGDLIIDKTDIDGSDSHNIWLSFGFVNRIMNISNFLILKITYFSVQPEFILILYIKTNKFVIMN